MSKRFLPIFMGTSIFWLLLDLFVFLSTSSNDGKLSSIFLTLVIIFSIISITFGVFALKSDSRKVLFPWLAGNFTVGALLLVLGIANLYFYSQEMKLANWNKETPDYMQVIPDPANEMVHPSIGGFLPESIIVDLKSDLEGETITFSTDKWGLRRIDDIELEKPDSTFRILNLGDSFVAGYRINDGQVFGSVIEEMYQKEVREKKYPYIDHVEVLNVVVLNPTLGLEHLQKHADKFDPDLIIYNVCLANDLLEMSLMDDGRKDRPRPLYFFDKLGRVKGVSTEEMLEVRDDYDAWFSAEQNKLPKDMFSPGWLENSEKFAEQFDPPIKESFALLRKIAFAIRIASVNSYEGFSHSPAADRPLFHWAQIEYLMNELPPPMQGSYEIFEQLMEGYAKESKRLGAPVIMTAIPMRYQVIEEDRIATFEEGPLDLQKFDLLRPQKFMAEKLPEYGIEFVDHTPVFSNQGEDAWKSYFAAPDIHWSAKGHKLAAENLKKSIDKYLLEQGHIE